MLTPADIEKIEFSATRVKAGYDQDEVDNFLDRVAGDFALTVKQLDDEKSNHQRTKNERASLQRQLDGYGDTPTAILPTVTGTPGLGDVTKLLAAAQQTADMLTTNAEAEARTVVEQANIEAAAILADAKGQARALIADATRSADAAKQAADAKLYATQNKLSDLNEAHMNARTFLANTLESAIRALDERKPS